MSRWAGRGRPQALPGEQSPACPQAGTMSTVCPSHLDKMTGECSFGEGSGGNKREKQCAALHGLPACTLLSQRCHGDVTDHLTAHWNSLAQRQYDVSAGQPRVTGFVPGGVLKCSSAEQITEVGRSQDSSVSVCECGGGTGDNGTGRHACGRSMLRFRLSEDPSAHP